MKNSLRELQTSDYDRGYLELLSELSVCDKGKISREDFEKYVEQLNRNPMKYTVVMLDNKTIVATATLLLETKLIHNISTVGHIEDVVIKSEHRKQGLGKSIVDSLVYVSKQLGCYKVILDCSRENTAFYEKCGFKEHGIEMSHYFPSNE